MDRSQPPDGLDIRYHVIGLTCETLLFGIFFVLVIASTYIMITKGLGGGSRRLLLAITLFMFITSTINWALTLAYILNDIEQRITPSRFDLAYPYDSCGVTCVLQVFDSILILNYVITDAVVVWRSWVLCRNEDKASRVLLNVALSLLTLAILFTLVLFGVSAAFTAKEFSVHEKLRNSKLGQVRDICRVGTIVFSLLTNIVATTTISMKAWRFRKWVTEVTSGKVSPAHKIMTLLVESGSIYCMLVIIVLVSLFIRLPFGTLGDLYHPLMVQLAGIYPTIIIILVNRNQSLGDTVFTGRQPESPGDDLTLESWRVASPRLHRGTGVDTMNDELDPTALDTRLMDSRDSKGEVRRKSGGL